jgi:ATP-binding cassette subfamily B protein
MQAEAEQAGLLEEHLSGTEDLRSAGATAFSLRRHAEQSRDLLHHTRRSAVFGTVVGTSAALGFRLASVGALALAAFLFRQDALTIGEVFLVFAYTQLLAGPLQVITRELEDLQTAIAAIGRVNELLDTEPKIGAGGSTPLPAGPLSVQLDDVTFRYEASSLEPTLAGVTLDLGAGRVLGVLGRTGSGKTTIAKLLVRFYDVDAGAVRLGGVDVRDAPLAQVRSRVGLVTQDVHLFHATTRENLTLFDPAIDDERIADVLRGVGLGDWLESLPNGLDTVLSGETGLSAGESQLLAFARVFLRDPSVVILDEATARLDPVTEGKVERAVTKLFAGRTAIVIAHRLATVARADDIAIVDDGRIVEHGERLALMADDGSRFAALLALGLEDANASRDG